MIPRLSWPRMLAYSAGSLGANVVNALTNFALPLYLGGYGLPNALIGLLAQERSLLGGPAQPVVGAISDRWRSSLGRRRPFFLIGIPLTSLGLIALALHPPVALVVAVLSVMAFFLAIAGDPYVALMGDVAPPDQRSLLGGLTAAANMVGQIVLVLVAARFWAHHECVVFGVAIVVLCGSFAITFFGVPEPADLPPRAPRRGLIPPLIYIRQILAHRELARYVGAAAFFWLGNGAAVPFLTRFGIEVLHVDDQTSFLLVFVALVCTGLFALPAGLLGQRLGKRPVLLTGIGCFVLATLIGSRVQTVPQAIVVMAAVGACNAVTTALLLPLLIDMTPPSRFGEFSGLGSMVWSVAQPIGSVLAGWSIDVSHSYRSVFVVAGLLMFVSGLLLCTVHPERSASDAGRAERAASAADPSLL